jgi:hypothetical protein
MRTLLCVSVLTVLAGAAMADPVRLPQGSAPPVPVQTPTAPPQTSPDAIARPVSPCDESGYRRADRAPASLSRLGDLPTADMHLLVRRRVNGCSVQTIVVRDVETNITRRR